MNLYRKNKKNLNKRYSKKLTTKPRKKPIKKSIKKITRKLRKKYNNKKITKKYKLFNKLAGTVGQVSIESVGKSFISNYFIRSKLNNVFYNYLLNEIIISIKATVYFDDKCKEYDILYMENLLNQLMKCQPAFIKIIEDNDKYPTNESKNENIRNTIYDDNIIIQQFNDISHDMSNVDIYIRKYLISLLKESIGKINRIIYIVKQLGNKKNIELTDYRYTYNNNIAIYVTDHGSHLTQKHQEQSEVDSSDYVYDLKNIPKYPDPKDIDSNELQNLNNALITQRITFTILFKELENINEEIIQKEKNSRNIDYAPKPKPKEFHL
tara:strand:- start:384 stop:1352 length:969 start_codon:yes stop_codon:yes gene_type:complete